MPFPLWIVTVFQKITDMNASINFYYCYRFYDFLDVLGPTEREREGPVSQPSQDSSEAEPAQFEVDAVEPMVLLAPDAGKFIVFLFNFLIVILLTS